MKYALHLGPHGANYLTEEEKSLNVDCFRRLSLEVCLFTYIQSFY